MNDGVAGEGGSAVRGLERGDQLAQHTPLWGTHAHCPGIGEVGVKFDCLRFVHEEFLNPGLCAGSLKSDSLLTRISGCIVLNAQSRAP